MFKKKPPIKGSSWQKRAPHKASHKESQENKDTSWQKSSAWYDQIVGEKGHYYHQHLILPNLEALLRKDLLKDKEAQWLDLACGQGILGRKLSSIPYTGIDLSSELIKKAKLYDLSAQHRYFVGDICKPLPLKEGALFSHASIILALQNIRYPVQAFKQAALHLKSGGQLLLVLNHPCFRIPRQSSWEFDAPHKIQYRRINRYHSSLEIPIQTHPSQQERSVETLSFHHPLALYSSWLKEAGFAIWQLDEWYSDKKSEGGRAKIEDSSRYEIPLFLFIQAIKL